MSTYFVIYRKQLDNRMKYFRLTLSVMTAMILSLSAYAQNLTVTGVVTDSSNGAGVPFAGVQIKGTTTGTVTDIDGNYSITAPSTGILVFSSIGYKDQEVAIDGMSTVNAVLSPDLRESEEGAVNLSGGSTNLAVKV